MPGLMDSIEGSLAMNVEDMFTHAKSVINEEIYKCNSEFYSGYMWVAALDWKTCLVCGEKDGHIYDALPGEEGKDVAPEQPLHHRCRCIMVPVLKGLEAEYSSPNWKEWLERQPGHIQIDVLGPARYKLYKETGDAGRFVKDGKVLSLEGVLKTLYHDLKLNNDFEPNNDAERDIIPENIFVEMKKLHEKDKGDGIEYFAIMTKEGSLLGSQDGVKVGQIKLSDRIEQILSNGEKNSIVMVHTHSSGLSFSGDDLFELVRFSSIDSTRIIGYNGITYYMSIGNGEYAFANDKARFMRVYNKYLSDNLVKHFGRTDITIEEQAYYIVSDTAKAIMKKYGWIYREGRNGR